MSCYDCGSTLKGHHTFFCEFAAKRHRRDLPSRARTQHWNGQPPIKATTNSINKLHAQVPNHRLSKAEIRQFEQLFNNL